MLRYRAVVALVVWTLLIWTTRIRNIWGDDELDATAKWGRTALALSFTVLAVAVAVAAWRRARPALRLSVLTLAGWTTAVWLVRSADITTGDHDAAFKIVHLVLAVVSIALSALAVANFGRIGPIRATSVEVSGGGAVRKTEEGQERPGREEPSATGARPAPASGSGSHPRP